MSAYNGTKRAPGDFAKRLLEIVADVLVEAGTEPEQATITAREIASRVCWEWGGNRVGIQRDPAFGGLTQRDRDIWAAFDGTNYDTLASEFGLSWRMVRYIISHARKWHKANTQPELPGINPDPIPQHPTTTEP